MEVAYQDCLYGLVLVGDVLLAVITTSTSGCRGYDRESSQSSAVLLLAWWLQRETGSSSGSKFEWQAKLQARKLQ